MKPRPPRLRLLGRVAGFAVYLVSGERVRDEVDIDFTLGGNEAVYTYVPPGEIWIDDAAHALDRTATALHELVERDLMLHHGMDYDRAHDAASARERLFRRGLVRRHPTKFDAHSVAIAYRAYLRETPRAGSPSKASPGRASPSKTSPGKVSPRKTSRQLEREITAALASTPRFPDGRAKGRRPGEFDPVQLRRGTQVEMEHTTDRRLAEQIAMDHLVEDPRYYVKLARVHLD